MMLRRKAESVWFWFGELAGGCNENSQQLSGGCMGLLQYTLWAALSPHPVTACPYRQSCCSILAVALVSRPSTGSNQRIHSARRLRPCSVAAIRC